MTLGVYLLQSVWSGYWWFKVGVHGTEFGVQGTSLIPEWMAQESPNFVLTTKF